MVKRSEITDQQNQLPALGHLTLISGPNNVWENIFQLFRVLSKRRIPICVLFLTIYNELSKVYLSQYLSVFKLPRGIDNQHWAVTSYDLTQFDQFAVPIS